MDINEIVSIIFVNNYFKKIADLILIPYQNINKVNYGLYKKDYIDTREEDNGS